MHRSNYIHLITIFISLIYGLNLYAQETELDKRNGFKDIKLGMPVDSVKGTKLKKEYKEGDNVRLSKLYDVEDEHYNSIGEVKVHKIEIKTYRDLVYEIKVVAEKDPRLMKAMESIYGQATYDAKNNRYFWRSEQLILTYESISKKELLLEYKSFLVLKLMTEDKAKKVENIADDF